jgi:hypothetical protein
MGFSGFGRLSPSEKALSLAVKYGCDGEGPKRQGKNRRIGTEVSPGKKFRLTGNRHAAEKSIVTVYAQQ